MPSESTLIITELPDFVSAEEHRSILASTPPSFNAIRSVLRHKEEGVSVTLDPPIQGFTAEDGASGVLYIIESALVFMSSTGRGLQVSYPTITLHAISRASGSNSSIYCQLDESHSASPPDDVAEAEDATAMRELMIMPQNPDSLDAIFEAMSQCASLHPDPNMSEEEEAVDVVSDGDFETFDGDGEEELSEVGRAALAHLESIIYDPETKLNGDPAGAEDILSE